MATTVNPNSDYATSTNVSKKYNPFDSKTLRLGNRDKELYSKMLTNRFNLLKSLSLLPQTLHLATTNWAQTEKAEVGRKPPLIIISSNRSAWIKRGIAAADAELATKKDWKSFNNVSDFRALQATAGQKVSPPIYCPKRIGASGPRSVFVVVHVSEYQTYKAALANSGITVVGWNFAKTIDGPSLAGFGASRFAAVQFCKTLRENVNDLGAVWDYAWFFDDNVIALTNFPGFEIAEAEIAKVADQVCIGFKGADFAYTFSVIPPWARKIGGPPNKLPAGTNQGILQQAGLWNIKYLATNFLNFPPVYVTSAEDISLNRYFNLKQTKYIIYQGIEVMKELTTFDGKSADKVNSARSHYANLFGAAESAAAAKNASPPPPVKVNYNGQDFTVNSFIANQLLPKGPPDKQVTAKCQAVEQITKTAMLISLIADDALTTTFKINGTNAQAVELYNSP